MTTCDIVPRVWCEDFKIHSYETGPSGFATPQAILRFLQEAASNHADTLNFSAEQLAARQQMWVLANLSLRMETYPLWHQTIAVETWPVFKDSNIRAYRDFTLRGENDEVIGRASTMWLLLGTENRRPQKIPNWSSDVACPGHEIEVLRQVKEKDFSGAPQVLREFVIRASEIDWNMHVNNVCYLEWALETIPANLRMQNKIAELDVSFVAEGKYGDSVIAQYFEPQANEAPHMHKIVEKSSNNVLSMVRTSWQLQRQFMSVRQSGSAAASGQWICKSV